jgi:hypothetical protein
MPSGQILYIASPLRHEKTGKAVRLIAWWLRYRLILKDMDAPGYEGSQFFPIEKPIGGGSNTCPIIDLIVPLKNGMGWKVRGETSEGNLFDFDFEADLVEGHVSYPSDPPYEPVTT